MKLKLLAAIGIVCFVVSLSCSGGVGGGIVRPERILSGYNGFWLDSGDPCEFLRQFLEPMHEAGFNACDLKIFPTNLDLDDPEQMRRLTELAGLIAERDMMFLAYVYPHRHDAKRNGALTPQLPALVTAEGVMVEDRYSLIHWPTWRYAFDCAFELAEASLTLPIAAVRLDLETINNLGFSYDDAAWQRFAQGHDVEVDVPAERRAALLDELGLREVYQQWFIDQVALVAKRFEREMHAINPDLMLGIMPAHPGWLLEAFIANLATERAPAIMDNWCMYNGEGFGDHVLAAQDWIKRLNPNNLFVPWFRVNSYRPDDIAVHAYHAAFATDGYSSWTMGMLNRDWADRPPTYDLPQGYTIDDYYAAYGRANHQLAADWQAGLTEPTSIALTAVDPLSPPLELADVTVPDLVPAGDGSGQPQWLSLRDQQVIYIYAEAGSDISVELRHLAGQRRPLALQYALLDRDGNFLRNESVSPGATDHFNVTAPATATYGLVVTGGTGGQAWYGVRVHNEHMALRVEPSGYVFYTQPMTLYFTRNGQGQAAVTLRTSSHQMFAAQFNDGETTTREAFDFELPADAQVAAVVISAPASLPEGYYIQDIYVGVEGAVGPYASDGPERRLVER